VLFQDNRRQAAHQATYIVNDAQVDLNRLYKGNVGFHNKMKIVKNNS